MSRPTERSLPRHTLPDIPAVAATPHGDLPVCDLPEKRWTLYSLTPDETQNYQWLKPHLLAQIEFAEWTPEGHLRHASLAGLRNDKEP
jgi:ATP dependent DNA ligase C terminal region